MLSKSLSAIFFAEQKLSLYITKRSEAVLQWGTTKKFKICRNTSKSPTKQILQQSPKPENTSDLAVYP